jgi:hypothetical protein
MKVGVNDYGFYYRVTTEKKEEEEEEEEELLLLLGVVIIDCLIKFTHFLIVKITYTTFQ